MFLDEAALISRKVDVEPAHQISQPYTSLSNNSSCWVSEALAWAISKQFSQTELRSHMLIKPQIGGPGDHLRAGPPPPPRSVKPAETGKHKRDGTQCPGREPSTERSLFPLYKHLCHRDPSEALAMPRHCFAGAVCSFLSFSVAL